MAPWLSFRIRLHDLCHWTFAVTQWVCVTSTLQHKVHVLNEFLVKGIRLVPTSVCEWAVFPLRSGAHVRDVVSVGIWHLHSFTENFSGIVHCSSPSGDQPQHFLFRRLQQHLTWGVKSRIVRIMSRITVSVLLFEGGMLLSRAGKCSPWVDFSCNCTLLEYLIFLSTFVHK